VHFECIIAFKAARTVVKLFKKLDPGRAQGVMVRPQGLYPRDNRVAGGNVWLGLLSF